MQVGDLVQHKGCGSYGVVMEVRPSIDGAAAMASIHWCIQECVMLHTARQLEVISENR